MGASAADLRIFDTNGRLVATFASVGLGSTVWDTRLVASGLYYYRLVSSGKLAAVGKVVVAH